MIQVVLTTFPSSSAWSSVVEQAQRRVREHDVMLVGRLDTLLVHDAPARRSKVLDATPARAVHIVGEREECVARASDAIELLRMRGALFLRESRRDLLKHGLPLRPLAALERLARDEEIDGVRLLGSLHTLLEW